MLKRASTKIAHNSTIPVLGATSQDLKPLQNLITAEKAVLVSLKKLSVDYLKASEALRVWGEGNNLGDILSASSSLLKIFSSALVEYSSHGDFMRKQLKLIRTKEESLDNLKRSRRNARRKAKDLDKKLSKMGPVHKNLALQKESFDRLQEEIRKMDSGIMLEETALGDFKRTATKAWMGLKFGGLVECCQKGTIAGEFGKLAIAEILEETTQPSMPRCLDPQSRVEGLVEEAYQRVNAVALTVTPSVGFRDRDQHNQKPSNSTSPVCPHGSPQTSHGHESSGEPQLPPTSALRNFNDSNPQAVNPFPFRSRNDKSRKTSGKSSSGSSSHVSPNQQLSQGSSSSFSQSVPSFQQFGVNEGAVNDTVINICAVHRNNTSSRLATSPVNTPPVNTPLPSSSKHQLQDSLPSSIGRQPIGDSSSSASMAGTPYSTPSSRFNGWSQPSEDHSNHQPMDSGDDAMFYNDPPPSFDDALLDDVPVGGSRSEVSLANTIGFSSTCHR